MLELCSKNSFTTSCCVVKNKGHILIICIISFVDRESVKSSNCSLLNEDTSDSTKKRKRRKKRKTLRAMRQESQEKTNIDGDQSNSRSTSRGSQHSDEAKTCNPNSDSDSANPVVSD